MAEPQRARRDWRVWVGVPALYVALAVALTWPAVETFNTRIAGDFGDTFQNLWNLWWFKESLLHLRNPFFTHLLRAPMGVTLVFNIFLIPDALVSLPLWLFLPPLGVYNAVVLWSFVLCGLGTYALVQELTGSRPVAIFAGAAFMALPFHLCHALGHQHLVSLGYLPLYLLFLHRIVKGGTLRDAVLGGVCLAFAAFCSWYQLLFAFIWSLGVFGLALVQSRGWLLSKAFAIRAVVLAAVFLAICGPLMFAMFRAARGEPVVGAHDAHVFSADVESFFFPGARMHWSAESRRFTHWTGNASENGNYLGYVLMALAAVGLWKRPAARAYGATGLIGALLSLGPSIHVAGAQSHDGETPYALLVKLVPGLDFSGVPVRFGLLAQGSLVVMAALGLAALLQERKAALAWGASALAMVAVLVELWPTPLPTSVWQVPAPMLEWGKSSEQFTVLDLSGDTRMLWNAIHHGKPCVGGYVTRVPQRLQKWWNDHPVLGHLDHPSDHPALRLERDDLRIAFDWGYGSPDRSIPPDYFTAHWDGFIEVPQDGEYTFATSADDGVSIAVDGQVVMPMPVEFQSGWHTAKAKLSAGRHAVAMDYVEDSGGAYVQVAWEGPGVQRQLLSAAPGGPGQPAAFHGKYYDAQPSIDVPRDEAQRLLREIGLRYVLLGIGDRIKLGLLINSVGMRPVWQGDGLVILELPPDPAHPYAAPPQ